MASKRGQRRRACQGKRRYATQDEAVLAIRGRVRATGGALGGRLAPYHCPSCGQFHIGHPPDRIKQAIADQKSSENA